jgi:hypothetical protein
MHKIIVPTLLGFIALAVILALHVSNIQAQYFPGGGSTTPQQPVITPQQIQYICIQTPKNGPEFGLEKGRYSTNINILHYENSDETLTIKYTIVDSVRAPDHNSQVVEMTVDIPPLIASVDIDCRHIVEKVGEGTGWVIFDSPVGPLIQFKATHTANRDLEI